MSDIIITCAVTGSIHTPSMSPHLPVSAEEITEQAVGAAEAGASILHLHARDPYTGRPSAEVDHFMAFLPRIHQRCDAVLNLSTGGSAIMSLDQRLAAPLAGRARDGLAQHGVDEFRPIPGGGADYRMETRLGEGRSLRTPTTSCSRTRRATSRAF